MKWLLTFLLILMPCSLNAAQPVFDFTHFARLPILHEGRIKPLDSFAQITLKQISGHSTRPNATAIEWLAGVLFDPAKAMEAKFFAVRSHDLVQMLSLPSRSDDLYSFSEVADVFGKHQTMLAALIEKDHKKLSPLERDLESLYISVDNFAEIFGTFSLLFPVQGIDQNMRMRLQMPLRGDVTYLDLLKVREKLAEWKDQSAVNLASRLNVIEKVNINNSLLRVIPPLWEGTEEWRAPWAVIQAGSGSPQGLALFRTWQELGNAYRQHDAPRWQQTSNQLLAGVLALHPKNLHTWALALEVMYNAVDPLTKSLICYLCGLGLMFAGYIWRKRAFARWVYGLVFVGAGFHLFALCARMAILLRPPVSTLYESMIYVSFVVIAIGLWLERKKQGSDGLLISGSIASVLLLASTIFAGDNDTLGVLVAVLNTNFWLATHVVCITTGYSAALVAGTLAHLYLWKRALRSASIDYLKLLLDRIYKIALVALLFSAVGTMLGGIWADQSWGRFWGWDPKENGALWIVLWLIWALHGRVAGQLRELGFAVVIALINIVVALAWVGVNLLGIGLHSYGFTDSAAFGLLTFCLLELVVIGAPAILIQNARKLLHAR